MKVYRRHKIFMSKAWMNQYLDGDVSLETASRFIEYDDTLSDVVLSPSNLKKRGRKSYYPEDLKLGGPRAHLFYLVRVETGEVSKVKHYITTDWIDLAFAPGPHRFDLVARVGLRALT